MRRLLTCSIVLLPLVPQAILFNLVPGLIDELRSGDIAAGLVLVLSGLGCLYVLTIQLALCLAGLARLTDVLHLPGAPTLRRAACTLSPRIARVALAGALGTGLGAAALPAQAAMQTEPDSPAPSAGSPGWPTSRTDPGWPTTAAPQRPENTATGSSSPPRAESTAESPIPPRDRPKNAQDPLPDAPQSSPAAPERTSQHAIVTVVRGDNLWSIARAQLSAQGTEHPTTARLAKQVDHIYSHNKSLIGSNPNLIMPGLRLEMP
ncbi:hypothetical protein NQ038_01930 [Brevibacterium sp. 50QC2O2]|uniref:LysM peptidoglycan-binding domain-containing protein n=1 Tax=Brevibacterium sp. 50QC2O2 TaxID=2968459 RepID=UPI00211C9FE2|nr:hypothetical protein [Brevibacterium sp. 50QC2O2]MCQ9387409.1 hypothetical protein [Brevibacterium sp. 50QC2O2]